MIRSERRRAARAKQLRLPGFEELGSQIRFDHRSVHIAAATLTDLRAYLRALYARNRSHPKITKLRELIAVLESKGGARRNASVQEALALDA
jgi:hypothetical protein